MHTRIPGTLGFTFRGTTISAAGTVVSSDSNNSTAGSSDDDVYIAVIVIVACVLIMLFVALAVIVQRSRRAPEMVVNEPPEKGSDVDDWFVIGHKAMSPTSFRSFDDATQTHYYGPVTTQSPMSPKSTKEKIYLDPHDRDSSTHTPADFASSQPTHFYPDSSGWNPNVGMRVA